MSVVGIDFGNDTCYIAVARQGGIETIANDYSLRHTPSCVAFGEKNRILGVAAKSQITTNLKNTILNFKRLVGKTLSDQSTQDELVGLPYRVIETKDGGVALTVQYLNEDHTFSITQITAMLFSKLKHTAETALGTKISDVVIGVPCYLDDAGRHAMIEAATAAGLNVLRLMNETTAVALAYGIYKQDLPPAEEKPRNVIFVDCGHTNLQVSAVAFNRGKLKMLTTTANEFLGGRDFDKIIADHFSVIFKEKYNLDVSSNVRARIRLLAEVEKLKKQMSANSTELPMNIECFMNDKDVSAKMKRVDFEEMCSSVLRQVESKLFHCLSDSGLQLDDIYSVEIVGGSSRIPAIKQLIEKVFGKAPSTTLNTDEAVARGCALQSAMLSPTFKVREFSVTDVQPYSIKLMWVDESGHEADLEVFPRNHQIPFSKILTFYRKEPFCVRALYSAPSPTSDPTIGEFAIQDVVPTTDGENSKVKVKVRINIHGLFMVSSASLIEKREVVEEEPTPMEVDENKTTETNQNHATNNQENDKTDKNDKNEDMETDKTAETEKEDKNKEKVDKAPPAPPKKLTKSIDLPVQSSFKCLMQNELDGLVELESKLVQADKLENDRINAKNGVEEYVYEMRGKIFEELQNYIGENDRGIFSKYLDETENWLYEDGEDCSKQIYVDKLTDLKKSGEPVKTRFRERLELPRAFASLQASLRGAAKLVDSFRSGEEALAHLDGAEVTKVESTVNEKHTWVDRQLGALKVSPMTTDAPIAVSAVQSEQRAFESMATPILNKPKPKPPKTEEPPPPPPPTTTDTANGPQNTKENPESKPEATQKSVDEMDVD